MSKNKNPYSILWNGITDAIQMLESQNYGLAKEILIKAQQNAEEAYIDASDT